MNRPQIRSDCSDDAFETLYGINYKAYDAENFPKIATKMPQQDPMLLTGHFQNNLQVNGHNMKSKIWPESTFGIEEYKSFVERLRKCKKRIYDMFFRRPDVRTDVIEEMLRDLEKTTYQVSYSPNVYVPVSERKRMQLDPVKANMKYHETTYRTYYNRIEELERFKKYMLGQLCKYDNEILKKDLRKTHLTGRSTYYETICLPAIAMSKVKSGFLEGFIDEHSWRRV